MPTDDNVPGALAPGARSFDPLLSESRRDRRYAYNEAMKPTSKATLKRVYGYIFAKVYPMYVAKAEKKGRTKAEVDEIIRWLTGYTASKLKAQLKNEVSLETFFRKAPKPNPLRKLITGTVCGVRVEEIKDPIMREMRYLDKLIDELAKGRPMEKILRK